MAGEPGATSSAPVDLGPKCPNCGEPWLRATNLPGRYRCVYCLHRFELTSVCPNCGDARVGHKVEGDVRMRVCKKCGQELPTKK